MIISRPLTGLAAFVVMALAQPAIAQDRTFVHDGVPFQVPLLRERDGGMRRDPRCLPFEA